MKMYGYGNFLATMSLSNPRLTRNIFSQIMNNRVDSSSKKVKNTLSEYDKKLSSAVKNSINGYDENKKISLDKESKKALANYFNASTPLYTGKSSISTDYYSAVGSLYNFLL